MLPSVFTFFTNMECIIRLDTYLGLCASILNLLCINLQIYKIWHKLIAVFRAINVT